MFVGLEGSSLSIYVHAVQIFGPVVIVELDVVSGPDWGERVVAGKYIIKFADLSH